MHKLFKSCLLKIKKATTNGIRVKIGKMIMYECDLLHKNALFVLIKNEQYRSYDLK